MGVIKPMSFLSQWKQTEAPSQSGWKAAAGSRAAGEAAKWYKLMKTTLAEPYRLPPPSECFQQLPPWGFHTWGPGRQKTVRGETEGDQKMEEWLILGSKTHLGQKPETMSFLSDPCTAWAVGTLSKVCYLSGPQCDYY